MFALGFSNQTMDYLRPEDKKVKGGRCGRVKSCNPVSHAWIHALALRDLRQTASPPWASVSLCVKWEQYQHFLQRRVGRL